MKCTLEEQETIIIWDRGNPEAIVYTFEPSLKRKLKDLKATIPDLVKLKKSDGDSVEYTIPKELISIRKPRTYSEAAKEQLKERGLKLAKSKRPEARQEQMNELQAF